MCGRYVIEPPSPEIMEMIREINRSKLAEMFREQGTSPVTAGGEILPASVVPAVATSRAGERKVFPMKWGFAQNGPGRPKTLLINARSETAAEKPTFREAWAKHRCVIPASCYLEWEHDEKKRPGQKYAIRPEKPGVLWLAGLYRVEGSLPSFVILTRPADASLAWMHNRMPLMLSEEDAAKWIRPEEDPAAVAAAGLTRMVWEQAG